MLNQIIICTIEFIIEVILIYSVIMKVSTKKVIFNGFVIFAILMECLAAVNQQCVHQIFCNQEILTAVSKSNIFQDSKEFVDLTLKVEVSEALKSFKKDSITDFINNNFISSDSILEQTTLSDYIENPPHFSVIKNKQILSFALDLNKRWNQLARKVDLSKSGGCSSECSSFLEVLDGRTIIIPGGRFKQAYYWDTYWIVKGLITSNMIESAENLVRNFFIIFDKYGFIPNGFRKYYLNRSQPPFLSLMVKQVVQAYYKQGQKQKAQKLQKQAFMKLVGQHNFWQSQKVKNIIINGENFKVNIYSANTTTPRPESYKQDMESVINITDQKQKQRVLKCISTMAQSGWDFSSRWLKEPNKLISTIIDEIVPNDLNAILGLTQSYLASLSSKFNRSDLQKYYIMNLNHRKEYFKALKNKNLIGIPDYGRASQNNSSYPSDFYPYLLNPEIINNIKLVYSDLINPVSSKVANGMQWDSPNVWAPNNWILHEVLPNKEAFQFAQQWVSTVYCSWKNQGLIYQKYRNDQLGKRGQGGQYKVQTGFGWSNGLAMYYIMLYPQFIQKPNCSS